MQVCRPGAQVTGTTLCVVGPMNGLPVELMEFSVESTADADDADADTAASSDDEGGGDADG